MMKLNVTVRQGVTVQVEAETQKELFQLYAQAWEVFGEKVCGICHGDRIRPVWRTASNGKQSYDFPEYHCLNPECRARLSFGQHIEGGTLFPHRKLDANGKPDREAGSWGDHNGWTQYKGEPAGNAQPQPQQPAYRR